MIAEGRLASYDAVMLHLMQAMLPALERPQEVSALYLDSIFLGVRDHIAEAYGSYTTRAASNRLGLTARQLRHALEYIEANLIHDVSLADVANASVTSVSSLTRGRILREWVAHYNRGRPHSNLARVFPTLAARRQQESTATTSSHGKR